MAVEKQVSMGPLCSWVRDGEFNNRWIDIVFRVLDVGDMSTTHGLYLAGPVPSVVSGVRLR